jgi:hypothetical protein
VEHYKLHISSADWKKEIEQVATQWPRVFRAHLRGGTWQLLGCSGDVQQQFAQAAQRLHVELKFPRSATDDITALLYRLAQNGHNVRSKQALGRHPGSMSLENQVTIYPLRKALIRYLNEDPDQQAKARSRLTPSDSGQAAAVKKNRMLAARWKILAAIQRSGQAYSEWPDVVKRFYKKQSRGLRQPVSPAAFQPPAFDRLNQSPESWIAAADQAWQHHRDRFLSCCQFWEETGVDEAVPAAKRSRGAGSGSAEKKRGANTAMALRFQWAAQYLSGMAIKEIAFQSGADVSTVGRVARETLRRAGWLRRRQRRGAA